METAYFSLYIPFVRSLVEYTWIVWPLFVGADYTLSILSSPRKTIFIYNIFIYKWIFRLLHSLSLSSCATLWIIYKWPPTRILFEYEVKYAAFYIHVIFMIFFIWVAWHFKEVKNVGPRLKKAHHICGFLFPALAITLMTILAVNRIYPKFFYGLYYRGYPVYFARDVITPVIVMLALVSMSQGRIAKSHITFYKILFVISLGILVVFFLMFANKILNEPYDNDFWWIVITLGIYFTLLSGMTLLKRLLQNRKPRPIQPKYYSSIGAISIGIALVGLIWLMWLFYFGENFYRAWLSYSTTLPAAGLIVGLFAVEIDVKSKWPLIGVLSNATLIAISIGWFCYFQWFL